jgi:hypothetical protein
MSRAAASLTAVALAFTGCGLFGGPLEKTAAKLGDIRSGILEMRVIASTPAGQRTGFELKGPFAMPEGEELPQANLTYTRFAGTAEDTFGFISTGKAAFIKVGERSYELPEEKVQSMRGSGSAGSRGPFSGLDLDGWVPDSEVVVSEQDSETETVTGDLDVVAAVNDLLGIAREYGGVDRPEIEGEDADLLRRAVKQASLELVTGKEDRILRSLAVSVDFGGDPPEAFKRALEGISGVNFTLELKLAQPNSEVTVKAPANPLPYERLAGR